MKKNTRGSLIWLRIARFTHQSNLLSNEFLKQFDITAAQFDVLNQVATYQPIMQSDLATKVTVSPGGDIAHAHSPGARRLYPAQARLEDEMDFSHL